MKVFKNIRNKINKILDDIAAHLGLEYRVVPVRIRSKNPKNRNQK
jgi:hypothetical protein